MVQGELIVSVAPAVEPLTLDEVKAHLRYTGTAEDVALGIQLTAAREQCELVVRRAFVTQTLELRLHAWPAADMVALPRPPLQEVLAVEYTTADGQLHTLPASDYVVYGQADPGRLYLKPGKSWPGDELMPGPAITVRYVAGYGDPADVPMRYRHAILLLLGTWFAVREHVTVGSVAREVPDSVRALLLTDRG
jgi:uncharacterized phiE125 gp8 family phage protein